MTWTLQAGLRGPAGPAGADGTPVDLGSQVSNRHLGVAAPASRTSPASNGSFFVPIAIAGPCTVTGLRYRTGSGTTSGNVRAALYSRDGQTRLANRSSSVAFGSTANRTTDVAFDSPVDLAPGLYWVCLIFSSSSATFMGWASSNDYLGPMGYAAQGSFATPSIFTPPSLVSLASQVVPMVATY